MDAEAACAGDGRAAGNRGAPSRCARGVRGVIMAAAVVMLPPLVSCAPSPLDDAWVEPRELAATDPTWRPPRLAGEGDRVEPPGAPPPAEAPAGELTLRDAVALSLLHSPELAAFAWEVRAAEARAVQAGLPPNPVIGAGAENFAGPSDADDMFMMSTLRLSQVIELAGKREKRLALAHADQRLEAWDYEARRLEVITETARRHVAVVAAQQRLELAQRTLRLAEQVMQIVQERVQAGVVPASQGDKAIVRVSVQRIAMDRATHQLRAARQALASSWAGGSPAFERAVGDLEQPVVVPEEAVVQAMAADHPRVARWPHEIEQRRRAVELARADGVPDVTAGGGIRIFPDAGEQAAVAELALELPVFDRNQGRVLEARYALAGAVAEQRAAEAAVRQEVAAAHAELASAVFAFTTLREEALPAARSAFEAARESFANGRTDFLDVLDAERTLVEVEQQMIDAMEARQLAAAALEGLIAAPLTEAALP